MEATAAIPDQAIPCPRCDYDLRGQTDPCCPECGEAFESLAELIEASQRAHNVFVTAMRWRQWIAAGILASFGLTIAIMSVGIVGYMNVRLRVVVLVLPVIIASSSAVVLLVQVVRWRFSRRVPRAMRKRLNGSIPLLAFESIPCVFLSLIALAVVFT